MLEILYQYFNKTKYRIIAGAVSVLYILGCRRGKETEQVKTMKGTLENVQEAKTIQDNVVDIDRIRQLHNKYKR